VSGENPLEVGEVSHGGHGPRVRAMTGYYQRFSSLSISPTNIARNNVFELQASRSLKGPFHARSVPI
jgi:hypothetical protein